MRHHGVDIATTGTEELNEWRRAFDEMRQRTATTPKVGLLKLKSIPGEQRYAVAGWTHLPVPQEWNGPDPLQLLAALRRSLTWDGRLEMAQDC